MIALMRSQRVSVVLALCGALASGTASDASLRSGSPIVRPNPNTERAGALHAGVLTVVLEARKASYEIDGPTHRPIDIEAFSEPGKAPLIPGPLVRAPAGTDLRFSIHNSLDVPLTFFIPAAAHGGPDRFDAMDSVVVAPGATGHLQTQASAPGNYIYRATTPAGAKWFRHMAGLLAGALVIDTAGATPPARDRVFLMMATVDSASTAYLDTVNPAQFRRGRIREVFTINGLSWPITERVHATVGDSLHWRVINASEAPHPMHLHGFYYRVDAFSGPETELYGRPFPRQMVVTQFMPGFSSMLMTWSPDRPGNWLFHCHFAVHLRPDSLSAAADDPYHRDMVGLALGTIVVFRARVALRSDAIPVRHLRLIATVEPKDAIVSQALEKPARTIDSIPSMHFVLEERGRDVDTHTDLSPELDLVRGEPVAITIVNHLPEATSIHWHGIEVEDSYMDGVPAFSGAGQHLTPAIAPGDSFVARFTPPRAGTFIYHAHIDEIREQLAGLEGAIIVREPGVAPSRDDHVFFFKEVSTSYARRFAINGESNPDTVVLHAGVPARLRLINLNSNAFAPTFVLARGPDTAIKLPGDSILSWTLVAKDGFDVRPTARRLRIARQVVSIGETYDFEYRSTARGALRLEIWSSEVPDVPLRPRLLVSVPIRVE
jgi:FtsP/CotA-like multicopper oxidase with cupredoxin domain